MSAQNRRVNWNIEIEMLLQKMARAMTGVKIDAQGRRGVYVVLPGSYRRRTMLIQTLVRWGIIIQAVGQLDEAKVKKPIGRKLRQLYQSDNDSAWQGAQIYLADPEAFAIVLRCFINKSIPRLKSEYHAGFGRYLVGQYDEDNDNRADFPFPVHTA